LVSVSLAFGKRDEAALVVGTAGILYISFILVAFPIFYLIFPYALEWSLKSSHLSAAIDVYPYVLCSLLFSLMGALWLSGLDGCNRIDLRSYISILGQFLLLILAIFFVPLNGLVGLAWAQVGQGLFVAFVSWMTLRKQLKIKKYLPIYWSEVEAKKIIRYSAAMQVGSISMFLFDPLTRMLLSRFGGVSFVAFFELASQVVLRVRALIVSSNQVVIPEIGRISIVGRDDISLFYSTNILVVAYFIFLSFGFLFFASGIVSYVFLGFLDFDFILVYEIVVLGWFLNTFNVPAYYINIGLGRLRVNIYSSIVMGLANLFLGAILGMVFGGLGVVVSYLISLFLGSWFLVNDFDKYGGGSIFMSTLKRISVIVVFFPAVLFVSFSAWRSFDVFWASLLLIVFLVFFLICWFHPARREIFGKISV
jgi:O-antigen/teichoic acid export membrane protein